MDENLDAEQPRKITGNDVVIDLLYLFAIAINVYVVVDAATDGQLTRETLAWLHRQQERAAEYHAKQRELRHDFFEMMQQAHEAVTVQKGDTEQT